MVSFMMFSMRFFMLLFMAWSFFHVADAGPPAKGGGKGKDKSKDKSKQWEQLVRSVLHDNEPLQEIESLPGDLDPHADTDFEEEDFEEEESEPEGALHTPDEGVTAADAARWDAIIAASRQSGYVQTQDAAINTEASSSAAPVAVDGPGHIDPTAGMAQEDRQYLRSLPGMSHFINMIERHDWTTPPDAAFTLACAGSLRDCLQDEGHNTEDIRSFAGEMLQNQRPHPPAAAPVSDADVSDSSTRSRSRTPTRSTGRACPPAVLRQLGLLQADGHMRIRERADSFPWHACNFMASRIHVDFTRVFASQNFLRWRAKCYVRRLPLARKHAKGRYIAFSWTGRLQASAATKRACEAVCQNRDISEAPQHCHLQSGRSINSSLR